MEPLVMARPPSKSSHLSTEQLNQVRQALEQDLLWLTSSTALAWIDVSHETGAVRTMKGERMRNRLHQIMEALDRIKAGTYGACSTCRRPIPFERLDIIPETPLCIMCGRD